MDISKFSKEKQDFIHDLFANAIIRAIENGTYKPLNPIEAEDEERDS